LRRTGRAELLLVDGGVPHFREMVELGGEVARLFIREYGEDLFVEKLADPYWLSCLSCVLGFEWNTSGQTTVTVMALKEAVERLGLGIAIVGGKGGWMRRTPLELRDAVARLGVGMELSLLRASRLSCRVDNNAIQDSYSVYFHAMAISPSGMYTIINQGMNVARRLARRYQWLRAERGVEEPHSAITSGGLEEVVLDLTSSGSRECRRCILDILEDSSASTIKSDLARVWSIVRGESRLDDVGPQPTAKIPAHLSPPRRLGDSVIAVAKRNLGSFESLLLAEGVGPSVLRGLAYISALVYGAPPSWRDPAKFTYAFGTKSGRPYPLDRGGMMRAAEVLRRCLESSRSLRALAMMRRLEGLLEGE